MTYKCYNTHTKATNLNVSGFLFCVKENLLDNLNLYLYILAVDI